MKKILLALVSVCSIAFAKPVVGNEAQIVVDSIGQPQNPSAEMLKAAMDSAKAKGLAIEGLAIVKLDKDRYQLSFRLNSEETSEVVEVSISELLIQDGRAYIFGFSVERVVKMKTHPGVSLGNN